MLMQRFLWLILLGLGLALYLVCAITLKSLPQRTQDDVLRVVLPAPIQTVLAMGDRYLAADAYITRAMTVSVLTKDSTTFEVQGKLQGQASILNPYNEDNVLLASAVLPWQGQLDAAQFVLARATHYRDWDYMAPFFQGFNEYYFRDDYLAAGKLAALAATRVEGNNRLALNNMASKWLSHGKDPEVAVGMIHALIEATNEPNQKRTLQARAFRLEWLVRLRRAADKYRSEQGESPRVLQDLVDKAYLPGLPNDPMGQGWVLDESGTPQFNRPQKQKKVKQ